MSCSAENRNSLLSGYIIFRELSNKRRRYSVVLAATRVEALSGDGDGHESEKRRRKIDVGRNGSSIEKFD
jgi:hypothetical protein